MNDVFSTLTGDIIKHLIISARSRPNSISRQIRFKLATKTSFSLTKKTVGQSTVQSKDSA